MLQWKQTQECFFKCKVTDPDSVVAMSSTNGLLGAGFASQYQLQPKAVFLKAHWVGIRPLHPLLSH